MIFLVNSLTLLCKLYTVFQTLKYVFTVKNDLAYRQDKVNLLPKSLMTLNAWACTLLHSNSKCSLLTLPENILI